MRGRVLGAFQSSNSLTLVIGPIVAGLLLQMRIDGVSPETEAALPLFVAAGLMAIAFLLSFRILRMDLPTQEAGSAQPTAAPAP
jgi:MFS family permease